MSNHPLRSDVKPPRILSASRSASNSNLKENPNVCNRGRSPAGKLTAQATSGGPHYQQQTASTIAKRKTGLNLREKIFELHDAVRDLQTKTQQNAKSVKLVRALSPERSQIN